MTKNLVFCIVIIATIVALSTTSVMMSPTYAQENQSANKSSKATSENVTNMSSFPTRATPGNITNASGSENVTVAPEPK